MRYTLRGDNGKRPESSQHRRRYMPTIHPIASCLPPERCQDSRGMWTSRRADECGREEETASRWTQWFQWLEEPMCMQNTMIKESHKQNEWNHLLVGEGEHSYMSNRKEGIEDRTCNDEFTLRWQPEGKDAQRYNLQNQQGTISLQSRVQREYAHVLCNTRSSTSDPSLSFHIRLIARNTRHPA